MKFKKYRLLKRIASICFWLTGIGVILAACLLVLIFLMGPPKMNPEENTTLYSANNEVIGVEKGVENRHWVEIDHLSEKVITATVELEDQHFYDHHGFDLKRIAGAIWKNLSTQSLKEGASTITQQLARNLYLSHEKTWNRKLKEAFYTMRLEMHYTKDEILEGYLNTIYYGHGAYGAEAASQYFFAKPQADLTWAEAAMLAGIPKGPTYYSPLNNEENANARKDMILKLLWQKDRMTDAEYTLAKQEALNYAETAVTAHAEIAPFFQDIVLQEAAQLLELTEEEIRSGGYKIYTTLDKELQAETESALEEIIPAESELEAAVLSIQPDTGAVLALSGGRDYTASMFNRVRSAKRMPGSSFKPFLYYAALGNGYTPLTKLMSKPTKFTLADGEIYQPSNFNHYYANEPITLAQAIALSDNVYAVRTNLYLGPETLVNTASMFGFEETLPAVASLALGTAAVSLEELASAYGMLANGGKELTSYTIEKIADKNDKAVFTRKPEKHEQILDAQTTFILTQLLQGIFDPKLNGYMPVTGSTISDELTRAYAGKSGTTPADNWMIGYSPSIVTGVWTGYDDNRNIEKLDETRYAKELWAKVMEYAHEGKSQDFFETPKGVVGVPIDMETGLKATPNCGENRMMYFIQGTEPQGYCEEQAIPKQIAEETDTGLFQKWFQLFLNEEE